MLLPRDLWQAQIEVAAESEDEKEKIIQALADFFCQTPKATDERERVSLLTGAALLVLAAVCIIIIPRIRYERYRYIIDSSNIRVREGILWIKETIIPMERLHKIQVSQGPVDRMFKLSSVRVTTAGGDGMIKFLADDEAALIVEHLKDKINQIAAEEHETLYTYA